MDIQNTDTISLVVKSDKALDMTECYEAFGWHFTGYKEDKNYGNIVHLNFTRPHKLKNKDRLQLCQVRMENAVNVIGKAESSKHSVSTTVGLILGTISLFFLYLGVKLLGIDHSLKVLFSLLSFVFCLGVAVFNGIFCKNIYKREKLEFNRIESENKSIVRENCEIARRLLGDDGKDEVAPSQT